MSDYEKLFKQIDGEAQTNIERMRTEIQLQSLGVYESDAKFVSKYKVLSEQLIYWIKTGYNIDIAIRNAKIGILNKQIDESNGIIRKLQEENKSLQAELDKTKNTNVTINVSCDGLNNNANYINEQIVKTLKEQMKRDWIKV